MARPAPAASPQPVRPIPGDVHSHPAYATADVLLAGAELVGAGIADIGGYIGHLPGVIVSSLGVGMHLGARQAHHGLRAHHAERTNKHLAIAAGKQPRDRNGKFSHK